MLPDEHHLLHLIDAYTAATGAPDSTISSRIFNDGKRIGQLRSGLEDNKSITVRKYRDVIEWFAANWPSNAKWPRGVERPKQGASA